MEPSINQTAFRYRRLPKNHIKHSEALDLAAHVPGGQGQRLWPRRRPWAGTVGTSSQPGNDKMIREMADAMVNHGMKRRRLRLRQYRRHLGRRSATPTATSDPTTSFPT